MPTNAPTGQVPADYSSPIGMFRLLAQDVGYTENVNTPGLGTYELFSDEEISGLLALYDGYSLYRAVAAGYTGLAARASLQARFIKDYDLQIDSTKQATAMQAIADAMMARAEREDELTGANSTFDLTPGAVDWQQELRYADPARWGVSPLQYVMGEGFIGYAAAEDIIEIGEGQFGEGIEITDGSAEVDGGDASGN